jgi:C4-dicarboxylate-specific signal transduction histidine kinase
MTSVLAPIDDQPKLDLNDVINEVLLLIGREVATRPVVIERQLAPDLPKVIGDRVQLHLLLFTLMVNALDAMEPIARNAQLLSVKSQHHDRGSIVVSVRDTGIGFGHPTRAFEPLCSTKPNGLGMGRTICRSIIEAHHGVLWGSRPRGPGPRSVSHSLCRPAKDDHAVDTHSSSRDTDRVHRNRPCGGAYDSH